MMDFQKMFDAMCKAGEQERSKYHLTLGALCDQPQSMDGNLPVEIDTGGAPYRPYSYRGYYSDMAFRKSDQPVTIDQFRKEANNALGEVFEGYKGGDFLMGDHTPLWISEYGSSSGQAVVGLSVIDGKAVLQTKQVD